MRRFLYDLSREVQDLVSLLRDRALEREKRVKQLEVWNRTAGVCGVWLPRRGSALGPRISSGSGCRALATQPLPSSKRA